MAEIKTLMLKPTSLASAIGKTDTEITVETIYDIGGVTIKDRLDGGESFSDIFGDKGQFTIAPRTDNTEVFTFTGITILSSGKVKLTGVTRGVKPFLPSGTDLKYARSHNSGEELVFSNTPIYYEQFVKLDGDQTFHDDMSFDEFPTKIGDLSPENDNQFATKKYIDDVSLAGVADATKTNKGIVEIATHDEVANKTENGDSGAKLVVPADEVNIPTNDEKDAMIGNGGTPDIDNKFVTEKHIINGLLSLSLSSSNYSKLIPSNNVRVSDTTASTISGSNMWAFAGNSPQNWLVKALKIFGAGTIRVFVDLKSSSASSDDDPTLAHIFVNGIYKTTISYSEGEDIEKKTDIMVNGISNTITVTIGNNSGNEHNAIFRSLKIAYDLE